MVRIWQGYHSEALQDLLRASFVANDLLILCSPLIKDFSFVDQLSEAVLATFPERPLWGVFTTGTTSGKPRLVLYSEKNIRVSLHSVFSLFEDSQIDTVFCYPQAFHTFGLVLGYLYAFFYQKNLVTADGPYQQSAHALRATLANENLLTLGTPAHFHDLLTLVNAGSLRIEPSYSAIVGGAKVSPSLWHDLQNRLKIKFPSIGYGASEASPGVTHLPPGMAPLEDGEVGFPLPGVSVQLKDQGGIEFSGQNLCVGILEEGMLIFPKSVLLSDLIEKRSDGRLVYVGRTSLIINRGGMKYSIEALEAFLSEKLNLRCACFAVPDPRLGEDLGVVVEALFEKSVGPPEMEAIKNNAKKALHSQYGHQFALRSFSCAPALPFNVNGKLERNQFEKHIHKDV